MFEEAAVLAAFALAYRQPNTTTFIVLFLLADFLAKTRPEMGIFYPVVLTLWIWKGARRGLWLPPVILVFLIPLYYPLLERGISCFVLPLPGTSAWSALGGPSTPWPWALSAAGAMIAWALIKTRRLRIWTACAMLSVPTALLYAVYGAQCGADPRLLIQAFPPTALLLGWAWVQLLRPAIGLGLAAILLLSGISWSQRSTARTHDTAAALAWLAKSSPAKSTILVVPNLDALCEWRFHGEIPAVSLQGIAPGAAWKIRGSHGKIDAANFFVRLEYLQGRHAWLVDDDAARSDTEADVVSGFLQRWAGHKPEQLVGGWRFRQMHVPGTARDPIASKEYSDQGVRALIGGDVRESSRLFKLALDLAPNNYEALLSYAELKRRQGDAAGCRALLGRAKIAIKGWEDIRPDLAEAVKGNCRIARDTANRLDL